ncbi:MAG: prepilin-type N-terminal cleavage/methylation domain-containing protein [Oscillospiraceae bacterium]|jgi:prepilin-type N-terminal cleavage/methylation domain-containing protein|nr:prepilin-type N-terminal cleavage/methylation domain-containing protein [Oscillospiraceae bacterium]
MEYLRKLKSKSGFTLVECLVAILVFAIMSLLVATILTSSMTAHRENMSETRSLRSQRRELLQGNDVARDAAAAERVFDFGSGITATYDFNAVIADSDPDFVARRGLELTRFNVDSVGATARYTPKPAMTLSFGTLIGDGKLIEDRQVVSLSAPLVSVLNQTVTGTWGSPDEANMNVRRYKLDSVDIAALNAMDSGPSASFLRDGPLTASVYYAYVVKVRVNATVPDRIGIDGNSIAETVTFNVARANAGGGMEIAGILKGAGSHVGFGRMPGDPAIDSTITLTRPAGQSAFPEYTFAIITEKAHDNTPQMLGLKQDVVS